MPESMETQGRVEPTFRAYFMDDLLRRVRKFDFLELSYVGGAAYKFGKDAHGLNVLIPHELELAGTDGRSVIQYVDSMNIASEGSLSSNRYIRRLRTSSYKNFVRPLVDRFAAYLTRNQPRRCINKPGVCTELERIDIGSFMEDAVCEGLKMSEVWIGYDSADIPFFDEYGNKIELTQSQLADIDPVNMGKPYPVMIDARRVMDYTEDDEGVITRVVFEERFVTKGGFTDPQKEQVYYKEWTPTEWRLYKLKKPNKSEAKSFTPNNPSDNRIVPVDGIANVELVEQRSHDFGEVPFRPFKPRFPIEDLCELNRLLFNVESLLDEELFSATFTQKIITGSTTDQVQTAFSGTGNVIVIENPEASIHVIGAIEGQAASLMNRCSQLIHDIHSLTGMEVGVKNVAEAAEKKKRDLEGLYTALLQVCREAERIENEILVGMGIVEKDAVEDYSEWDRKFDVESVADLIDEIKELSNVAFVPSVYLKNKASDLMAKLDPHDDHKKTRDQVEKMVNTNPVVLESLETLMRLGTITADAVIVVLGLPDDEETRKMIEEKISNHKSGQDLLNELGFGAAPGGDEDKENEEDQSDEFGEGTDQSGAGDDTGDNGDENGADESRSG